MTVLYVKKKHPYGDRLILISGTSRRRAYTNTKTFLKMGCMEPMLEVQCVPYRIKVGHGEEWWGAVCVCVCLSLTGLGMASGSSLFCACAAGAGA